MATLFLHAAFLDAPTLSCSVDWFDVNRHNKRRKHLKKATVDFVFESDGVTRCRGRTLPPTKDVGWYTAMPLDDDTATLPTRGRLPKGRAQEAKVWGEGRTTREGGTDGPRKGLQ